MCVSGPPPLRRQRHCLQQCDSCAKKRGASRGRVIWDLFLSPAQGAHEWFVQSCGTADHLGSVCAVCGRLGMGTSLGDLRAVRVLPSGGGMLAGGAPSKHSAPTLRTRSLGATQLVIGASCRTQRPPSAMARIDVGRCRIVTIVAPCSRRGPRGARLCKVHVCVADERSRTMALGPYV